MDLVHEEMSRLRDGLFARAANSAGWSRRKSFVGDIPRGLVEAKIYARGHGRDDNPLSEIVEFQSNLRLDANDICEAWQQHPR